MAVIACPECGKSVSDKAENCIHCGYPLISPLTKLCPKMNQLWKAEQWQECLNVCNEILLIDPKNYVAILRLELCKVYMNDDLSTALSGYEKAVKAFNESTDVSSADADRFALCIRELFNCAVRNYNKLLETRESLGKLRNQVSGYQLFAPLGSTTSVASNLMYTDAKTKFQKFEANVTPMVETWAKTIYQNYPEKLASISEVGKKDYEWIARTAVILNPAMRPTVEIKHSAILEQQDWKNRVAEYERKREPARICLIGAVIFVILPMLFPMMRPDLDSETIGILVLISLIFSVCFAIPYFYIKTKYKDVVKKDKTENN